VVLLGSLILPGYDLLAVYPSFERLLAASIEKEADRTAQHLLRMLGGKEQDPATFSWEKIDQAVWDRLHHAAMDFGLWKTRVFSPGGEIIFSTISEEIGQWNKNDYFFDVVATGKPFTKIERKQGKTMEGEVLPVDVVETYIPVMHEGRFLGAIEVYYDITEERGLLQSLLLRSGLIFIGLIVAIVLAVILLLIRTAMESRKLAWTQKNLNAQEMMFRDVIDSAQDGIMVTDARQRIKIVNPAFSELTGYSEQDVLDQTPSILSSGRHDASFYERMWRSIHKHKSWRGEIWNRRKDGSVYPELLNISTIDDKMDGVTHYVGIITDITQQKASEQRYQKMAYHDPLTKLPNRLLFLDRLEQAMRESVRSGEHVALLFLDLDGFKQVNDSAGHDAGDALLQEVARRLSTAVRRDDTVARIGGDEFTLLLRNVNSRDVLELMANKLIRAINEPITVEDASFQVGASVGIACYPGDAGDAETLIIVADEAMYEAKQSGKNRFVLRCDSLVIEYGAEEGA
jgi:diguanylate cyclase (GGDEF)-like protein/PAS domain S-box-containing protein